jgi:formate/nitrite transporter
MGSSFKSPVDTAKALAGIAGLKENSPMGNVIILSFLAGAYIAFGGLLAVVVTSGMKAAGFPPGLEKFFFGAVFPVGLMLVVIAGSELFTGNNMYMPIGILTGKSTWLGLTKNWVLSWVFNFVGAVFVAFVLAYLTGILTAEPFTAKITGVVEAKMALGWDQAFFRAIGCNWLVCLAVYLAIASDDIIGKILGIWFPIMAFVAIGFEHSVANMFFIPAGIFAANATTWSAFIMDNLIPVTLGNIVGGAIFVALLYWYTYLRGQDL